MTAIAHRILGLLSETPIHAGAGGREDVIDLPIQREAHTGWPCIYGSSVKGALRARAEQLDMDETLQTIGFGPDTDNASEHAGSLLVSDARLLLLPVRSLTGRFRKVTCPALLRRLLADMARAGQSIPGVALPRPEAGSAWVAARQGQAEIFLEEFRFELSDWDGVEPWLELLGSLIAPVPGITANEQQEELREQLLVLDDDSFANLCHTAVPILPHIRIESATKTVSGGALWYEENLPTDTLLYVALGSQHSRKEGEAKSADEILDEVSDTLFAPPYLQIGGNETTGMGWCRVGIREAQA